MAHFAKIGIDNTVLRIVCFDDVYTSTEGGIEKESLGSEWLKEQTVDDDGDIMNSWTVNTTTGVWEPPITKPSSEPTEDERNAASGDDLRWIWDESLYQSDNTKGWVLKTT